MPQRLRATGLIFSLGSFLPSIVFAQAPGTPLPKFGMAVSISTLGVGIQAATAVTHKSNVRFGFNYFDNDSLTTTYNKDGIAYDGTLSLRSAEVLFDYYVKGPFHVSPGFMLYDGNKGSAKASVQGSQSFRLGEVNYYSQASNPLLGTGTIEARKAAPMVLVGFGNLLPRSSRHFTVNLDLGVVFQGSPKAKLNLAGGACTTSPTSGCLDVASNAVIQANVQAEQNTLNHDLSVFKYYPVVSLSFGYKF